MKTMHQTEVSLDIFKAGTSMIHFLKKDHGLGLSMTNIDVICRGVILNFISSLEWLDRYLPVSTQSPLKENFSGTMKDTTELALEVCCGGNSTTSRAASNDLNQTK